MKHLEPDEATKLALQKLFGFYVPITKIANKNGIELDCGSYCTITLDKLLQVAEIFGTNKIDVNNSIYYGGGCETCSYEEAQIKLQVYEPTKNVPK